MPDSSKKNQYTKLRFLVANHPKFMRRALTVFESDDPTLTRLMLDYILLKSSMELFRKAYSKK